MKVMKCDFLHFSFFRFCLVFVLITAWLFSGWPQIWQNPSVPPEIQLTFAGNILTNPSFTGGTEGWILLSTEGDVNYDADYFQDTAGSLRAISDVGRNRRATGYGEQTINQTIDSTDEILLSHFWSKQCVADTCRDSDIEIQIAKPSAPDTWVTIWSDGTIPPAGGPTAWAGPSDLDVSSYFDETGEYKFRLNFDLRGANDPSGQALAWFDNISLDVVSDEPSTAIEIRAQDYTTLVSTITFPQGAPETTVSQPYNNVDGSGSPQTFGDADTAKPVVTLYNGSASSLIVWYNITTFTNDIVSSENYLVNDKGAACADADNITESVTFDEDTNTGVTIAAGDGNEKDLYLKIALSSVAGKTGESTLTILGETP